MTALAAWLASPPPDAAIEVTPDRVSAASMAPAAGRTLAVQAYASQALPPGAIVPSLTAPNLVDRAPVAAAVQAALGQLGIRPRRVALIVPDVVARVSLLRFERVPARRDDLDQLIRWQLRKSAPFAVDDACITYSDAASDGDGGSEFVVALARREIIQEYESVCSDAGAHAGLVDLATLSILNLFLASRDVPVGDWLLVHVRPEYTSIAIMRGDRLIFFRNRPEGDEGTLADMVHQTAMYYQDRLSGQRFTRVLLGGSGRMAGAMDEARRSLEERLEAAVESVDPKRVTALPRGLSATPEITDALAPLTGILLRTHAEPDVRTRRAGTRDASA